LLSRATIRLVQDVRNVKLRVRDAGMLYVDGVYKRSIATSIALPRMHIGAAYIASSSRFVDYMRGGLDEVLTFNRILDDNEIAGIYSAGKTPTG
jgi:hypothetical protein